MNIASAPDPQACILVVDDTPLNLEVLTRMLEKAGYAVQSAGSGTRALELARRAPPDLILLDINMPEMNGFEVCEQLKADAALQEIPVIFVSALTQVLDKVRAFAVGGADYITKPFQFEEVQARVRLQLKLRQAQQALRQALEKERELGELKANFVALTSHEFRTPLTTIFSSAEMLELYGHKWSAEKKTEHLRRIQASAMHMSALLNNVLVIGQAEAGKMEFKPAPVELVKFCRDLAEEFELSAGAGRLVFTAPPALPRLEASLDERLLRHILSNLLSNALKYSPPESAVRFELACPAGQLIFVVQDHGIGIPAGDRARLFEMFHRAANVGRTSGTGLGLAIAHKAAAAHGGTITVDSQEGAGATFTVTLPLAG